MEGAYGPPKGREAYTRNVRRKSAEITEKRADRILSALFLLLTYEWRFDILYLYMYTLYG